MYLSLILTPRRNIKPNQHYISSKNEPKPPNDPEQT